MNLMLIEGKERLDGASQEEEAMLRLNMEICALTLGNVHACYVLAD